MTVVNPTTSTNTPLSASTEHTFASFVRVLGKGKKGSRSLTREEARDAMQSIISGEATDLQIGAFLMLLRVKEESPEELAGFVEAARQTINAPAIQIDLDWSSYAGKRRHLPWFLLAVFALADQGIRVFMHGTGGHTAGRLYTEQALATLGIQAAKDWQEVDSQLAQTQFSFMPLSQLCPPLERLIHLKSELGLRSCINTLCRQLNPLAANASLQSIFHPAYAQKHAEAARLLGQANMAVFKGDGGEIECRPEANTRLQMITNNDLAEESWPKQLQGKQAEEDVSQLQPLLDAWHGQPHPYGEQAILQTLALALRVLGKATTVTEAQAQATSVWQARNPQRLPRHITG